ncbi:MAG: tRNA (adenosine(37)-N6)-threonylcarbamoyltransferase complex ATPase subunit type 1 TsaE [Clostridia bacterium]
MKYISTSVKQTISIAKQYAKTLCKGDTVVLQGELGAGKTHFCKGLASGLGVKETITSPTFAIHNRYVGKILLNHFDFYRLDQEEAQNMGLEEIIDEANSVSVIEWADNAPSLIPQTHKTVKITIVDQTTREIEL